MQTTQTTVTKNAYNKLRNAIAESWALVPLVKDACEFGFTQADYLRRSLVSEHDVRNAIICHIKAANLRQKLTIEQRMRLSKVAHLAAGISE
jgi:hypothetical protein